MKPQVKAGRRKPRLFFDRKVRTEGYSRSLSMGKIIPKEWRYVRITLLGQNDLSRMILIQKLLGENNIAQIEKAHTGRKQNT